jgi:hypothetical protein
MSISLANSRSITPAGDGATSITSAVVRLMPYLRGRQPVLKFLNAGAVCHLSQPRGPLAEGRALRELRRRLATPTHCQLRKTTDRG